MYLSEEDIPNFNDYLKLSKKQKHEVQFMLAAFYKMIKEQEGYVHPVQWLIEQDMIELESLEAYEACKLYLDTIEQLERILDKPL